ncbi:MAG: S8 family serine peptidase [Pseudomonadota bacterium]
MFTGLLAAMCRVVAMLALGGALGVAPAVAADDEPPQVLVMLELPPPHFRADGGYGGSYADGAGRQARRRVAHELAQAHGLQLQGDWPMPLLGVHCFVMALPPQRDTAQAVQALAADRRVAWAQPMQEFRAQRDETDPLYRVQPAAEPWQLQALHQRATGRGVQVAVIDSGVDDRHPDLAGQVVRRENFVRRQAYQAEQHGTGVAAVIAARAGNGVGIVGVAPQARLQALRACRQQPDEASRCDTLSLAQALHHAIEHEAQVINLSLAGPPDRLLARLLDIALARDIDVVGAADLGLPQGGFPASHPGVIAVVAQARQRPPAGLWAAPGQDIPTATPGGRWTLRSGSSFAAAHVAGLLALRRELHGPRAPRPHAALVSDASGAVDACATLRVMNACACGCPSASAEPAAAPARP